MFAKKRPSVFQLKELKRGRILFTLQGILEFPKAARVALIAFVSAAPPPIAS